MTNIKGVKKEDHIRLCEHCICGIESHGAKILVLDDFYYDEDYDDVEDITCEWCEDELPKDMVFDCIFR